MHGNIQLEILNEQNIMLGCHLKDVSDFDKQVIIMTLAKGLEMSPVDIMLTSIMYPEFSERAKSAKIDLSNKRSTTEQ